MEIKNLSGAIRNQKVDRGLTRRELITSGFKGLAALSVMGSASRWLDCFFENKLEIEAGEKGTEREKELATPVQIEIEKEDEKVIEEVVGKTITQQLQEGGEVILDLSTKKAIQARWKKSYSKRPEDCPETDKESGRNHLGLLEAMNRMKPWIAEMKEQFSKVGVPEKFVYLTIPESHFQFDARSSKKAGGPYQFVEATGKEYGLMINDKIDERCDPIKSAEACAKFLLYLYNRFNKDWDLVLSGYNGGFANRYRNDREKEEMNYADYLKWREERINSFIKEDKKTKYKVVAGDTLTKISRRFGVSIERLRELGRLKSDEIYVGQELVISEKPDLGDSLENLNYPEKFYAILEVIKEERLEELFPAVRLGYNEFKTPVSNFENIEIKIKKGDNLYQIAKRIIGKKEVSSKTINSLVKKIEEQNGLKSAGLIRPGQTLKIKINRSRALSLSEVSSIRQISLKDLKKFNPGIKNEQRSLPNGYILREPKQVLVHK